jgi:hypothetical protein
MGCGANRTSGRDTVFRPPFQRAENTVIQTADGVISLSCILKRSNWRFRMRCISSMPDIVTAVFRKRLKPSITLPLDLTF